MPANAKPPATPGDIYFPRTEPVPPPRIYSARPPVNRTPAHAHCQTARPPPTRIYPAA